MVRFKRLIGITMPLVRSKWLIAPPVLLLAASALGDWNYEPIAKIEPTDTVRVWSPSEQSGTIELQCTFLATGPVLVFQFDTHPDSKYAHVDILVTAQVDDSMPYAFEARSRALPARTGISLVDSINKRSFIRELVRGDSVRVRVSTIAETFSYSVGLQGFGEKAEKLLSQCGFDQSFH